MFAIAGIRLFLALVPAGVPRLDEVRVNMPVLLFAAGVSILSAVAFGILPALRSLSVHPQAALQGSSTRTANTQEGTRIRSIMVGAQVACTVVLLIVTSLAIRGFARLMRQDRGFDAGHVTVAQVDLFTPRMTRAGRRELPSGSPLSIAHSQLSPVAGCAIGHGHQRCAADGRNLGRQPVVPTIPFRRGKEPRINVRWIDSDYLPTMQSSAGGGRNFSAADRANPHVALISERTAREGFPGENPVGRTITNILPDDTGARHDRWSGFGRAH